MSRTLYRRIILVLAWVFTIGVLFQIFFAGLGIFQWNVVRTFNVAGRPYFGLHVTFGYILGDLSLLLFVLAIIGRYPGTIVRQTGLLLVLNAVQSLLVWFGKDSALIAALHPVNAIAIIWAGRILTQKLGEIETEVQARQASSGTDQGQAESAKDEPTPGSTHAG